MLLCQNKSLSLICSHYEHALFISKNSMSIATATLKINWLPQASQIKMDNWHFCMLQSQSPF